MDKKLDADLEEAKNDDLGDVDTNIEGFEDDPEILALKKQIEAENAKAAVHKREKTVDMEKRLEQQIAELAENVPEKGEGGRALIEADPELLNLYKDIDAKYKTEMDDLWNKYVEDTKAEKIEHSTDFGEVHSAIMSNPFLRKMIKPTDQHGKEVKSLIKDEYNLPKCLLYDLLIEKLNMHTACVPDYALKKMLMEHEPNLKSKYRSLVNGK